MGLRFLSIWAVFCGFLTFADGVPVGPHGGHLLTSDAWHLEVVLDEKKGALLYLLNTQDKNPNVENASVYFLLKSKGFETNYYCPPVSHHFRCPIPHAAKRSGGDELIISASRKGVTHKFVYKYPHETQTVSTKPEPVAQPTSK